MSKKRHQRGFGLLEGLLALGALSALSLGIYVALKPTSASATAQREQANLRDLAGSVERSFGLLGTYEGVSADRVRTDGLAPTRMVEGSSLRTSWGSSINITSHSVNQPNDAFVVTYPLAPADVCVRLATAVSTQAFDIRVDGVSLFSGGQIDPAAAAAECGLRDASTMEFVYHSGLVAGAAVAAPPLEMPTAPASVAPPSSTPIGGSVAPVEAVGGADGLAPVTVAPAAPVAPTPAAPPAPVSPVIPTTPTVTTPPSVTAPVGTVAACVVPPNTVQNQDVNCAAGQYGVIKQSRFATWSCPEAWDLPVQGAFSAWSTTSNTCASCPGATTQAETQWVNGSSACPAGQTGSITWQYEQSRTRSVTYNCPAGTRTLPGPSYGGWSGWANTGATRNTVNSCVTPPSGNCDWKLDSETMPPNFGNLIGEFVGYSDGAGFHCSAQWGGPSGDSSAAAKSAVAACQAKIPGKPGPGASYEIREYSDNFMEYAANYRAQCAPPPCVVPNPSSQTNTETRVATQTVGCSAGQTGSITQTRNEMRTQTRSAYCPASTGAFAWGGWSGWSAWTATSGWATTSNTCVSTPLTCADAYAAAVAKGRVFFQGGAPGSRNPGYPPGTPIFTGTGAACVGNIPTSWVAVFDKTADAEVYWMNTSTGF